jgi:phosphatidylinositol alpha-1,6-mannosyltransferase
MPRIVSEVPGTRYVIVGDGAYREHLTWLADASPVADAITFLGALNDDEKFDCYSRCDVFAQPSEIEWLGIVYLGANAFGKPVVGGRMGAFPRPWCMEKPAFSSIRTANPRSRRP